MACCRDEASVAALNDWYDSTHLPDVASAGVEGLLRLTRFEVHRVVMADRMSDLFVESGTAVFQQIRDERR